ncbi:MAG: hypothetical protein ACI977_000755 [Candidatus Nanohaloarchaea archaeon]|jgi:hypothetical protein
MKSKLTILLIALIALSSLGAASFTVESDIPTLNSGFEGEQHIYQITLNKQSNETVEIDLSTTGAIEGIVDIPSSVTLEDDTHNIPITINVPNVNGEEFYTGDIRLTGDGKTENIPVALRATEREQASIDADIAPTSSNIRPDNLIGIITILSGRGEEERVSIVYELRDSATGNLIKNRTTQRVFNGTETFRKNIVPEDNLPVGDYFIQAHVKHSNSTVTSTSTLSVTDPFWNPLKIRIMLILVIGGIIIGGGFYAQRWYRNKQEEDSRYVFPVDYSKLPRGEDDAFEVGQIAEADKESYIDPDDLTTHTIVSGSTGSGKSVTANIIAEEALENDIPVIVFDPTAQWTGFVKELKDDDLLEHYDRFGMDKEEDPHPYKGIIKEIDSADPEIDFQELQQPGEITVFTLNQLTTEQFDQAVRKIIDQIFQIEWEESPELEMLVVFDEVHRLLEDYGGEGGYKSLEKGAREFRKWGIGLMMCSQVTADFKQAISGNIMTEVQMQTKSMEDIKRVEKKYGEQFSKRISSEDVGTGMIQNSNYNDGDPWFVDFRPTYHNPHKIPDQELQKYHDLSSSLDELKDILSEKEDNGEDVRDKKLELQLAENKLKEGRFKMANMYINSLKDEMDIS